MIRWRTPVVAAVVVMVATVLVPSLTAAGPAPAATPSARAARKPCNGHAELCARRLDQVTLAGAHNAYATAADGFTDVAQTLPVSAQLDAGVRVLLLDVYQGTPTTDHVCTDPTPLKVDQMTRRFGKQTVDGLIAIRNAQCPPAGGPTTALYLCHDLCEGGATKLADTLAQVRDFLVANPREAVVLMLEDYAEAPDIAAAFADAGLAKYLVTKKPGAPWPTLGKMVSSNRRLVAFSEKQGGEPAWLMPAFDEIQDTPYTFRTAEEFSCAPNRGPKRARLFLVNHWLAAADAQEAVGNAATVNALPVLLGRAEQCAKERDHPVNLLVVEFAEVGDLMAAADSLNEVET